MQPTQLKSTSCLLMVAIGEELIRETNVNVQKAEMPTVSHLGKREAVCEEPPCPYRQVAESIAKGWGDACLAMRFYIL